MDINTSLDDAVGLPKELTTMHVSIHGDNAGALIWQRLSHLSTYPNESIMLPRIFGFVKI